MDSASWRDAIEELGPLEARIDAAIACGDVASAMGLAFDGANRAASLVAGPPAARDSATVHGVMVELTPLPLEVFDDGTLAENGAYVSLTYRCWDISQAEAERLAGRWRGCESWTVDSS